MVIVVSLRPRTVTTDDVELWVVDGDNMFPREGAERMMYCSLFLPVSLSLSVTCLLRFLPCNAMMSVTRRYSSETTKGIIKLLSPSDSHTTLVFFSTKLYDNIPTVTRLTGGVD